MDEYSAQVQRDLEKRTASGAYIYASAWLLIGLGTGFAQSETIFFQTILVSLIFLGMLRFVYSKYAQRLVKKHAWLGTLIIYSSALVPALIMSVIFSASFIVEFLQPLFLYLLLAVFAFLSGGIVVFAPRPNLSFLYLLVLIVPAAFTTIVLSNNHYLEASLLVIYGAYMLSTSRKLNCEYDQLVRQQIELRALSNEDSLTGIANRRAFENAMELDWVTHKRTQSYIALVLVDIDHFKNINDTFGHSIGDQVIVKVAQTITSICMRETDCVARIGGEEFAVILPMSDPESAGLLAEKMKNAIADAAIESEGKTINLTASLGVALCIPSNELSVGELFKQADESLYDAKEGGRDRVVSKVM